VPALAALLKNSRWASSRTACQPTVALFVELNQQAILALKEKSLQGALAAPL
jgi:hypothetical protein